MDSVFKKHIGGQHFHYYMVCKRKLWLYWNEITMELSFDKVKAGTVLHENAYSRRSSSRREIVIEGCKIDHYNTNTQLVHETKYSDAMEEAHQLQAFYYVYVLRKNGIDAKGIVLEYPKMKVVNVYEYTQAWEDKILFHLEKIKEIIQQPNIPALLNNKVCKSCAYEEFCYSNEPDLK